MRLAMVGCVLGFLSGCVFSPTSDDNGALGSDDVDDVDSPTGEFEDRDECKIEDEEIGIDDVAVPTPVGEVRVVSWTLKTGEDGEFVGFTLSRNARFIVKAGGETWAGEGTSWTHPNGDGGSEVPAISHIDFCEDDGGGDDGGGDDGGGDDGGGDDCGVDGCDDGGGGGGELPPID
jgi:hypothetical protein